VQGYVQRVREKVGSQKAHILIKWLMPRLKGITPVVNGKKCLLCDTFVVSMPATVHIVLSHRDYVNEVTRRILNGGGKG
jgi:hypothetical protein